MSAHRDAPTGSGLAHWRTRRWRPWEVVLVALAYAFLSWLPVGYRGRGGDIPAAMGAMGWPFWTIPGSILLSLAAFVAGWFLMGLPQRRWAVPLYVVGMALCLYATLLVYNHYGPHFAPLSDRATALQYGFEELRAGHNPYYRHTQLDNTISPMLGGIILAGPFVLAHGDLWWQGMIWLGIVMAFLSWLCGARTGLVAGALLVFSPAIRFEVSIQSDGWINGAALAVSGTLLYLLAGRYRRSRWWTAAYVAAALFFALAFSYRFIYAVIALPLGVLLWRHYGLRAMLTAAVPAGVASAVLIFGPYLADPTVYAPFTKASLGTSETTVPGLPLITAIACVAITLVGTLLMRSLAGVWGTMFAVSLVFVVLTGWGQHAWYQYLTYAYNGAALIFVLFALSLPLRPPPDAATDRSLLADLRSGGADSG